MVVESCPPPRLRAVRAVKVLTSYNSGMQVLVDALTELQGDKIQLSSPAISLDKASSGRYTVHLKDGATHEADAVVIATPAYATATIINELV